MQKRILAIVLFLIGVNLVFAQETYIPDDNFENYLETHNTIGEVVSVGDPTSMGNGIANDDYVTTARIENVLVLDISELSITDVTGIEAFKDLQDLNCQNNEITSINVSQNLALQVLKLSRNNLTSINVSQNVALVTLSCNQNKLNELDVTKNIALKHLYCYANSLVSLDVLQNTLLENLDCVENNLKSLDVTKNTELKYLQVYENELTSIDVSKNVKLIELYVEYNQLTSLDVSKNTVLEDLSCYSNQLTYLNIRNGNNINLDHRDFDITNNPNLTCVSVDDPVYATTTFSKKDAQTNFNASCSITQVPDKNFENYLETHNSNGGIVVVGDPTSLGNGIANDSQVGTERIQNVEYLNVSNQGITSFVGLEAFTKLKELRAFNNTISSGNLDLTANTSLEVISCSNMGLTSIDISGLNVLKTLEVGTNNLNSIDVSSNILLENIKIINSQLSTIDLSYNTRLKDLRVQSNNLTVLDISTNVLLNYLSCRDNKLTNLDLQNNILLENLNCGKNSITTIDISGLSKLTDLFIDNTSTLTTLDVSNNTNLEDIGVNNTPLTSLDFSNNTNLIEVYTYSTQITALDFSNSPNVEYIECNDSALTSLNLKNGNNGSSIELYATGNPNLFCIKVDDSSASYLSSWEKDVVANYSNDCNWTYIPDDNFENYLETHNINGDIVSVGDPSSMGNGIANDNHVATSQIEQVTSLTVFFQNITDFTGIQAFEALEKFYCSYNIITSKVLNLTGNTNLKELQCTDMEITSLNVTGLTLLEAIKASRNDLSIVDVSTNANLKELELSSNTLSDIDVSNNFLLEDLQIHETKLSTLNVSTNTKLTRIIASGNQLTMLNLENNVLLDYLSLGNNPLESIDVSNLPNLDRLYIDSTNITTLDVSNNPNLNDFSANDNSNLNYLNVKNGANANISDFEAKNNPNLNCIEVDDPVASYLTSWVKDATANFAQYCRFTYVPDDNFESYLETHRENTGTVPFGDERSLGNGIMDDLVPTEKIENLTILFIENQNISDFTGVEEFIALQRLRAYGNPVNGVLDLTANTNLTQVFCWNMGLTSINVTGLNNLLQLSVNENNLMSIDISTNTNLEDLEIGDNSLNTINVTQNVNLQGLNYINNSITTIDLSQNEKLKFLYCDNNGITALNLQNNLLIETLELGTNPITNVNVSGLTKLVNLYIQNTGISSIDLSNNPDLNRLEAYDTGLTVLDVSYNTKLSKLIVQNNAITELDLGNNIELTELNASNNELTYLNVKNGKTDRVASVDIANNPSLTCIEVDDFTASYLSTWTKDATANFAEYCRFTAITDANFEAYLETHAIYGNNTVLGNPNSLGNGIIDDGLVPTEKLEKAQFLYLSGLGITDLTGIENCIALTRLNIADNTIANLDVSANTKLQQLYAANMGLTSLNITGLTELQKLDVKNNKLNAIDISEHINLLEVYVADNNLKNLDVSLNNLTYLDISNNTIATINLNGQANLENFKCDSTDITTLNIQNNKALEVLSLSNTAINTLNVTHLSSLRELFFNSTAISSIDVSNNININRLFCNDTQLISLDISKLQSLNTLSCKNNQLTYLNVKNGNNGSMNNVDLTGNPSLTCIEVDNPLSSDISTWLKDATTNYAEFCQLTYIPNDNFEALLEERGLGNGVSGDNYIATKLIENEKVLIIQDKDITNVTGIEDFKALEVLLIRRSNLEAINLTQNVKLTHLNLTNNNLTSLDLGKNNLLDKVYIDENPNLGTVDVSKLINVTALGLSNTGINTVDISNNPLLRVLNLNDNEFTSLDISLYSNIVQLRIVNNQLTSLNVANGNNTNFTWFEASENPNLTCIQVDDASLDSSLWIKDTTANYSLDCNEVVWTGINGRDWNEITNWSGNAVPLTTNNVIVPNVTTSPVIQTGESVQVNDITIETLASFDITGNGALTVDGSFTNNGTFAISSDATNSGALIVKGTANGNVTYERGGLLANKWSIITAPVSGQSIKEFIEAPENNIRVNNTVTPKRYAVAYYDDTKAEGTKWTYYTADDIQTNALTFEQGKGYIISRATNGSVKFTGAIETADVNIAVQADQWNSIGSPYTAYIPINNNGNANFIQENISKFNPANVGVYIWDTTQNKYVAKTLVGEATSLTVGQGFFVKTTAGVSSIAFKKAQRLSEATNVKVFSRKATIPSIQVLATQGTITVDTNITYLASATEDLDPGYDVGNFGGAEFDVFTRLVSETSKQNFTLQSLPNVNYEDMVIPLVIKSKVGKEISISMNIENLPTGIEVYLEDRLLGIETKLSDKDATYKINFKEKVDEEGRFYIHTKSASLDVSEVNEKTVSIYATTNKHVIIEGVNGENFTVEIFNTLGLKVIEGSYKGVDKNIISMADLSTGAYIIKLTSDKQTTTEKIIIE